MYQALQKANQEEVFFFLVRTWSPGNSSTNRMMVESMPCKKKCIPFRHLPHGGYCGAVFCAPLICVSAYQPDERVQNI